MIRYCYKILKPFSIRRETLGDSISYRVSKRPHDFYDFEGRPSAISHFTCEQHPDIPRLVKNKTIKLVTTIKDWDVPVPVYISHRY